MRLLVFPPNKSLESVLTKLYLFDDTCSMKLNVSTKSGITCNSNQNTQKKALTNFPSSYLKMQIEDKRVLYSYYIDLDHDVACKDIEDAFSRIREDINF